VDKDLKQQVKTLTGKDCNNVQDMQTALLIELLKKTKGVEL
jgi:hypothetical protein